MQNREGSLLPQTGFACFNEYPWVSHMREIEMKSFVQLIYVIFLSYCPSLFLWLVNRWQTNRNHTNNTSFWKRRILVYRNIREQHFKIDINLREVDIIVKDVNSESFKEAINKIGLSSWERGDSWPRTEKV